MRQPTSAESSSFLDRFPKNTPKADCSSLYNMCNSTSELLATTYLDLDSRSPSGRLPVGRIQIRVRTTLPHVPAQTSGAVPGRHVDLSLISSSLHPHASSIGRWIHIVSYRSNMPCQAPRTRIGDVAPRDYLRSIICIHAPGSSASCFLYSPMKYSCI